MSNQKVYEIAFRLGASINSSVRTAFASANRNLSDTNRNTENLSKKSGTLSKGMKGLAATTLAAGVAVAGLAAGLGSAVKQFDEFNGSMKQIQASTGASLAEMAEIKKVSQNLYNENLGEDWNDLADSISTAKSVTQLSGKELEKATANAIVYRDVWGEDVSQSIKATDTMMKNFGISSTQAYNLMAQGAQKGLNKSDELIDSANEYAPYFATLGFNANEMFDVFSTGLKNGAFNLDKVGDAVKEFGIRSKDGSKASMEAYDALGLSGEKMTQTFAKGGPTAQKAFNQVVKAIGNVKDPAEQSAIAVSLFGTQAEDLEMKVITSLGSVKNQFDMTKDTMEDVKNIKYDTLGMALQGIGRQIQTGFLIPAGEKLLPVMQNFSNFLKDNMPGIKKSFSETFSSMGDFAAKAFDNIGPLFESMKVSVLPVISQIGSVAISLFQKISDFWAQSGPKIMGAYATIFKIGQTVFSGLVGIIQAVLPVIQPILSNVVGFIMEVVGQVTAFWSENGAQIISAVQNVFGGIAAIVKFLAPVLLFIINMIWGNIKGVIQGGLSIIMGLIKIFAGLFTGDFSKMWEGIKQLFFGSIKFIWNLVNLLFYGKILGGIKALASGAIGKVAGMWGSIKGFFSGGVSSVGTKILELGPKVRAGFSTAKTAAIDLAKSMWLGIKTQFNKIVEGAKALPGRIGSGIKSMASAALDGTISMGNKLLKGIGKVVNGVIDGLNFIMGKKGLSLGISINNWDVPQYANGTSGHPGGFAILGDGRGSNAGPELYRTPSGFTGLSPGTDTLMNLPKGTQVIPAKETREVLSSIPAYKTGNVKDALATGAKWVGNKTVDGAKAVADKTKEGANWAADKTKAGAKKVKDAAFDIYEYASDPGKLMNKLLEKYNVTTPSFSGAFGDIAKGGFKLVKDKATSFLKDKLGDFGGFGGGGSSVNISGGAAAWRGQIIRAAAVMQEALSGSELNGIIAQIQRESGGNQRIVQSPQVRDINTRNNNPARGLLQYIPQTFASYRMKGAGNIYDGYHQLLAFFNNTNWRRDLPYGKRGWGPTGARKFKGFYKGGRVDSSQWAMVGEQGPELMKMRGGDQVFSNKKSNAMLSNLLSFGTTPEPSEKTDSKESPQEINVVYNPQIIVEGNADERTLAKALKLSFEEFKQFMKQYEKEKKRLAFD